MAGDRVAMLLAQAGPLGPFEDVFVRLFDAGAVSVLAGVGLVGVSVAIGAAHAVAPGHGKALVAGYLVGERGRPRDAVAFGVVVAIMHTVSVLVVAVGLHLATRAAAGRGSLPPILEAGPFLTGAAGVIVTAVGAAMVRRHVLRRRRAHAHTGSTHADAGHTDHADAGHTDHAHLSALPEDVSPLSRRGLVLLGVSGGLLPSPSAFLVLTTGLFTGRTAFAILLVTAFSIGLALTLSAIGLAVVWGRDLVVARATARGGRLARALRTIPLASGVAVLMAGLYLVGRAAVDLT
jgi:nickel/cobalt transporter (NicO) family protein